MSAHSGRSTPGQDDGDGDDDIWHLLHFPGDLITVDVWLFGLVRVVLLLMVASHLTRNMLSVYILLASGWEVFSNVFGKRKIRGLEAIKLVSSLHCNAFNLSSS